MDPTSPLDPNDPAVLGALLDDDCMRVWECLRRLTTATDLATLAERCGICVTETGRQLDRLVAAKLVRKVRARGARRLPTFTVTTDAITIVIAPRTPQSKQLIAQLADQADRRHAALVANRKPLALAGGHDTYFGEVHALALDPDDLRELRRRLVHVAEFLELHAQRAEQNPGSAGGRCNYMVSVQAAPLAEPVLPLPVVAVNAVDVTPNRPRGFETTAAALSARELHIARELRDGRTRTEIAQRLRVSPHTVHTHCKRLFRKLGIDRASDLHRFALQPLQESSSHGDAQG